MSESDGSRGPSRPSVSTEHPLRQAADRGVRATVAALLTSVVLGAIKIAAGVLGNSYALVADGVESLLDVVSSTVVWGALRIGVTAPTHRYPYGLGKVEPLAGMVVAFMLLLAAAGIAVQAVRGILEPHQAPAPFTLAVLVGVVVTKEALFRALSQHGREIGSRAMAADAWHHRSDALTSRAAFVGISVALVGGGGIRERGRLGGALRLWRDRLQRCGARPRRARRSPGRRRFPRCRATHPRRRPFR